MSETTFRWARVLSVGAVSMLAAAACSSGTVVGSSGGTSGASGSSGTSGSSGSSGGTSGSSGSSGSSASGGPGAACTEFHIGGQNDPTIGGTRQHQVTAQAVADFAGATASQILALTASCKKVAAALGTSSADQAKADAVPVATDKVKVWCTLAMQTINATKEKAGGSFQVMQSGASTCKLSVAQKIACQGRCSASGTCDAVANPVVCTGGTLSGGYCLDGKLEGGCQVDARCDASCDLSVTAAEMCSAPSVTISTLGAVDATSAALLTTTLEANLPSIIMLEKQFTVESQYGSSVSSVADAVSDLKLACVPLILVAAEDARFDLTAGQIAATSVINTLQQ